MGIERAPAIDQIMTHNINYDAAKRINQSMIQSFDENGQTKYSQREINEAHRILTCYDKSMGLDSLRNEKLDKTTCHGHVKFDIEKNLKKWLKS